MGGPAGRSLERLLDANANRAADGRRALAVAHDGRAVIVADSLIDGFVPTANAADPLYAGDTILDGELVGAGAAITFYAFDVVAVAGENVTSDGFERRRAQLYCGGGEYGRQSGYGE